MSVVKASFCGKVVNPLDPVLTFSEKKLIVEAISRNTTAFIERDEKGKKEILGNKTEGALLDMVEKWKFDYSLLRNSD